MKTDNRSSDICEWSREKLFDEVKHSINGNNSRQALMFLDALRSHCFAKDAEIRILIEKLVEWSHVLNS